MNQDQRDSDKPTWCVDCSGGLTRSQHTPEQPDSSDQCASCFYNATHPLIPLMTLDQLEARMAQVGEIPSQMLFDELRDKLVDWHGTPARICILDLSIRLEVEFTCCSCDASGPTVYMGQGLHKGAWPYAYDEQNQYLMNVRDQEYTCDACLPQHEAALARLTHYKRQP